MAKKSGKKRRKRRKMDHQQVLHATKKELNRLSDRIHGLPSTSYKDAKRLRLEARHAQLRDKVIPKCEQCLGVKDNTDEDFSPSFLYLELQRASMDV